MRLLTLVVLLSCACLPCAASDVVWLSSLDLGKIEQGWGKALADRAVTGKPLSLAGKKFEKGVGTHARQCRFCPARRPGGALPGGVRH